MKQRQVVVLRHAYDTPRREVAELLGISPATVDTHLARGLAKLRAELRES
jgi:RNA polymerase sigma factor (sigma-70 family)